MKNNQQNNLKKIYVHDIAPLDSERVRQYIEKATNFNKVGQFRFNIKGSNFFLNNETLKKLQKFDLFLNKTDYIEKSDGVNRLFSLVPMPYIQLENHNRKKKISGLDMASLGTNGIAIVDGDFPRIYSNWQLNEYSVEPYVNSQIEPGWYLFLRVTLCDFCNLSYVEQKQKLARHPIKTILTSLGLLNPTCESAISNVETAYAVGCIESLLINNPLNIPIKRGFLRTRSHYRDGTRMGILGSSYGFDMDGFWSGEGGGSNIAIAICFKVQSFA